MSDTVSKAPEARTDYASWERAHIDREYSPSSCAHRPLLTYLEEYATRSRAARIRLRNFRELPYGDSPAETLDLFVPETPARGLQVFFHGGYWSALSKNEFSYLAQPFIAAGMAFVSINYSLLPEVDLDVIVRQSRDALLWLSDNASGLSLDDHRIFLSGHSAGAHLAALCLGTDWTVHAPHRKPPPLGGACLISGIYDLAPLAHTSENSIFRLTSAMVERNSPINHLPATTHNVILSYGEQETREFKLQTHAYAAACAARGIAPKLLQLPNLDHFEAVSELAEANSALFRAALEQMLTT
jgi:arylformamidase